VEPAYTEEARALKLEGTVVLVLTVGIDGAPSNITLAKGIGLGLDESALDAICQWRFRPALRDGQPVPVLANVEVNFRLM
jgi:protein TonB